MFATGKAGAFSAQVPASQTWPIHHMNPSRPMNCFLSRDSFNISLRRSYTRRRRGFRHNTFQTLWDHDDPLGVLYDNALTALVRLLYDDASEVKGSDLEGVLYPSRYASLYFP